MNWEQESLSPIHQTANTRASFCQHLFSRELNWGILNRSNKRLRAAALTAGACAEYQLDEHGIECVHTICLFAHLGSAAIAGQTISEVFCWCKA
jgi:hypothetical protein